MAAAAAIKKIQSHIKAAWEPEDHKELRLLVTGKTGEGKSTLVNGLLGEVVAREGATSIRCTTEVAEYKAVLHGVPVTVYDSPGLQDNTGNEDEYLENMRKKCQNLSLVLYCTKMTNHRLKDEDQSAILKLTFSFGQRFWEYAVLVLTFANHEDVSRRDDRDEDEGPEPDLDDDDGWKELGKKRFEGRLAKWKNDFHKFLIEEVGIRRDIVESIPVVPAGDHKKTRENRKPFCLPDRDNWFGSFWKSCSLRVREMNLFYKVNRHRIVIDAETSHTNQPPHRPQPTSDSAAATVSPIDSEAVMVAIEEEFSDDLVEMLQDNENIDEVNSNLLQLTPTAAVENETYTAKLQENLSRMDKEAWVKKQEEETRKEKEKFEREAKERRQEIEREAAEAKRRSEREAAETRRRSEREAAETRRRSEREAAETRRRSEREAAETRRRSEREAAKTKREADEKKRRSEREAEETRKRSEREAEEIRRKSRSETTNNGATTYYADQPHNLASEISGLHGIEIHLTEQDLKKATGEALNRKYGKGKGDWIKEMLEKLVKSLPWFLRWLFSKLLGL